MSNLEEKAMEALRTVEDPDLHRDIVALQMVKDLVVEGGKASFTVELTTPACPLKEQIQRECEEAVGAIEGINEVAVTMSARVRQGGVGEGRAAIPGVRNIIAVGSGKGGVGKSTTAVNLAMALSLSGAKVAVLDADIYGPNVPSMLGAAGRPQVIENRMVPIKSQGISIMSMGFMVTDDQPLVWRGPMLHGVLKQLLQDTNWGEQDYLIVDLPPGTGDIHLSLSQTVPVTGAVIVTTPQNIALQDARKGVAMFQKVKLPILGIVENMAYYLCPKCGNRDEIFSSEGGENTAKKIGVPFLGRVPLNTHIREGMDTGKPVAAREDLEFHQIYKDIAQKVAQQVSIHISRTNDTIFA